MTAPPPTRLSSAPRTRGRWMIGLAALLVVCTGGAASTPAAPHSALAPRAEAKGTSPGQLALGLQTAATLAATDAPLRDLLDLARRLRLHRSVALAPVADPVAHDYAVGRVERFFVGYNTMSGFFVMTARLLLKTPHAYWYVDERVKVDQAALQRSAQAFESHIYATDRLNFGAERTPSIDHEPRVTILSGHVPGVGGYFSSEDLYPRTVAPYSNERKMIYFNTDNSRPGTPSFDLTLAHEFQHMIHWHMHPRQDAWINEGSSMLAQQLNGYGADGDEQVLAQMPDTQLDTWTTDTDRDIAHYGASFLWMLYFYQHYGGQKALRLMMADRSKTGMALFDDVLHKLGSADTSTDMFRSWVVANYLDNPVLERGIYGYTGVTMHATVTPTVSTIPATVNRLLPQYATNYVGVKLPATGTRLTLHFRGNPTVPLVSAPLSPAAWLWWSNRGDQMNTTLTRTFDLRHVAAATLHYALWYDTEKDFDYGYVEVSTDNGATWYPQRATGTTMTNPNGSNYANGFTGRSATVPGAAGGWLRESLNLAPFAGKRIQVRFDYVTDDVNNGEGLVLGRVSVPEIGFAQDPSSGVGWDSNGWVRVRNIVPETWLVQAIVRAHGTERVVQVPVAAGSGTLTLPTSGVTGIVLAVSPLAPLTTVPASYSLSVAQ